MYGNFQFSQNLLNTLIQNPTDVSKSMNYSLNLAPDNSRMFNFLYQNSLYDVNFTNEMAIKQHNPNINIPLIFNYNPYISLNYGQMNATFNNYNSNLYEFPFQIQSMNCNEFPFLNIKRNRDPSEKENFPEKNTHYYFAKNEQNQKEENADRLINNDMTTSFNSSENIEIGELDKFLSENKKIKAENENLDSIDKKNEPEDQKKIIGTKIGIKNKKMCKELLKDSLLEHIGETKPELLAPSFENGQLSIVIDNYSGCNKQNSCSKKSKAKEKSNNTKIDKKNPNLKKKNMNNQTSTVIYHDKDYQNTKNVEDFMKYNFNYHVPKNYAKKWIPYYKNRQVNLKKLNQIFPAIHNENLENIKPKWLRSKFDGNDVQLNKVINKIQEKNKANRLILDEEKSLSLLKENEYNIEELSNQKYI